MEKYIRYILRTIPKNTDILVKIILGLMSDVMFAGFSNHICTTLRALPILLCDSE